MHSSKSLDKSQDPAPTKWRLLDLETIHDFRGDLTFVENDRHISFNIARIYYLHGVPPDAERAGHAHRALQQLIIPVNGSFRIHLEDGYHKETRTLDNPEVGLLMDPFVWRVLDNFSTDAVCVVLASIPYDETDYIRSYAEFLQITREKQW